MHDTRLIICDSIRGSGKSSTEQYITESLQRPTH